MSEYNLVNLEQQKAKEELEFLESRYSLEISNYKISLEENTKYIEQLKTEVILKC